MNVIGTTKQLPDKNQELVCLYKNKLHYGIFKVVVTSRNASKSYSRFKIWVNDAKKISHWRYLTLSEVDEWFPLKDITLLLRHNDTLSDAYKKAVADGIETHKKAQYWQAKLHDAEVELHHIKQSFIYRWFIS